MSPVPCLTECAAANKALPIEWLAGTFPGAPAAELKLAIAVLSKADLDSKSKIAALTKADLDNKNEIAALKASVKEAIDAAPGEDGKLFLRG